MMGRKKFFKKWQPDPKISSLIKPFYDRGFPAYVAADLLLRDEEGNIVKNPNVKTYFKYWNFWKEQAIEEQRKKNFQTIIKLQKEFETKYLTAYDKLILAAYEMEKTLESCRRFKNIGLFDYENFDPTVSHIDIELKLEIMIFRITKLWTEIIYSKYVVENDIILFKFNKRKFDKKLRNLTFKTHRILLRVIDFLSKRESRKAVLDCQIKEHTHESIVIKCGICPIMTIIQAQPSDRSSDLRCLFN